MFKRRKHRFRAAGVVGSPQERYTRWDARTTLTRSVVVDGLLIALLQVSGATEIAEDECIDNRPVRRIGRDVKGLRITKF